MRIALATWWRLTMTERWICIRLPSLYRKTEELEIRRRLPDGEATLNIAGRSDFGTTAALQLDGKIVAAGFARNGATGGLALVRMLP